MSATADFTALAAVSSNGASWVSSNWAYPAWSLRKTNSACWPGWRPAATAIWITWNATARAAAGPDELVRDTAGDLGAHGLLARCAPGDRSAAGETMTGPTWPAMPWGATTTRCCAGGCRNSRTGSRRSRCVRLPGLHRQRAGAGEGPGTGAGLGWIGKHTNLNQQGCGVVVLPGRTLYRPAPALDEAASEHCGTCRTCMDVCPTGCYRGALPTGCAALHRLPDPSSTRAASRRNSARPWATAILRLRRLPAVLPLEQVRPGERRSGLHAAGGIGWTPKTHGAVRLDEARVPETHRGQRHPPYRLMKAGSEHRVALGNAPATDTVMDWRSGAGITSV